MKSNCVFYFVALEGLEPSLKVPETCVLPLHHKAMWSFKTYFRILIGSLA